MLYVDARGFERQCQACISSAGVQRHLGGGVERGSGPHFPVRGTMLTFARLSELIVSDLGLPNSRRSEFGRKYSVLNWRSWLYRLVLRRLRPGCAAGSELRSVRAVSRGERALGFPLSKCSTASSAKTIRIQSSGHALDFDQQAHAAAGSSDGLWLLVGRPAAGFRARPAWPNSRGRRAPDRVRPRVAPAPVLC